MNATYKHNIESQKGCLKHLILLAMTIAAIAFQASVAAHNKVVVIPLLGDEAPTHKTVFITKNLYNGNLGGPTGADEKCQYEADNLPGSKVKGKTFKAWVSGGFATDLANNGRVFTRSSLPYKRTDGKLVANNFADLLDSSDLYKTIEHYADGEPLPKELFFDNDVWTGTLANGTVGLNCNLWTSAENNVYGRVGIVYSNTSEWTSQSNSLCDAYHRLYCFEQ